MIIQNHFTVNEREFVRTYSDTGHYVVGGSPYGQYTEAIDPAEFNRQYEESEELDNTNAAAADYENSLADLGVRFSD